MNSIMKTLTVIFVMALVLLVSAEPLSAQERLSLERAAYERYAKIFSLEEGEQTLDEFIMYMINMMAMTKSFAQVTETKLKDGNAEGVFDALGVGMMGFVIDSIMPNQEDKLEFMRRYESLIDDAVRRKDWEK